MKCSEKYTLNIHYDEIVVCFLTLNKEVYPYDRLCLF